MRDPRSCLAKANYASRQSTFSRNILILDTNLGYVIREMTDMLKYERKLDARQSTIFNNTMGQLYYPPPSPHLFQCCVDARIRLVFVYFYGSNIERGEEGGRNIIKVLNIRGESFRNHI
jgi:hypothetical protein